MRVTVIGTRGIPNIQGGVETHCESLYPRLVDLGCEVTLIRRSCYVTPENSANHYKGVQLIDVYAPKKKSMEAILHSFLSVIKAKQIKTDLLHVHAIGPSLVIPFARLLGLKVVMTHHGPDYDRQKWGKLAKASLRLGERWGAKWANQIISISHVITNLISTKYGRNEDVNLVYNGVIPPTRIPTTEYISSLGLQKGMYILAMGRFVPEKGFDLLIDAFAQLKEKYPQVNLVIAGDADHETPYSIQLKRQAEENQVVMTGFIKGDKLNELLSHAALFVLPSYHEGLPISLLEAMSYKLDVLVSDIPANKEVKLPKESFFRTGDKQDLQDKLLEKLDKEGNEITYDLTDYDWDEIARKTKSIYDKVLSGSNKNVK